MCAEIICQVYLKVIILCRCFLLMWCWVYKWRRFLTSYKGQWYHLNEQRHNHTPRNKELFNYKYYTTRKELKDALDSLRWDGVYFGEDGTFILCYVDLKSKSGWNRDNGSFSLSYLIHLERTMAEKILNCQIKGIQISI